MLCTTVTLGSGRPCRNFRQRDSKFCFTHRERLQSNSCSIVNFGSKQDSSSLVRDVAASVLEGGDSNCGTFGKNSVINRIMKKMVKNKIYAVKRRLRDGEPMNWLFCNGYVITSRGAVIRLDGTRVAIENEHLGLAVAYVTEQYRIRDAHIARNTNVAQKYDTAKEKEDLYNNFCVPMMTAADKDGGTVRDITNMKANADKHPNKAEKMGEVINTCNTMANSTIMTAVKNAADND